MGVPREQENYVPVSTVTAIQTSDYEASFFDVIRCHPGTVDNLLKVTLPVTNGAVDEGKWVDVIMVDKTGDGFVRIVGEGTLEITGKKGKKKKKIVKKKKKYWQTKKKKLHYVGDLIQGHRFVPYTNASNPITLTRVDQSVRLIWDGVESWWVDTSQGMGAAVRGAEYEKRRDNKGVVQPPGYHSIPLDIFSGAIAGQSPPTIVITNTYWPARQFVLNDKLFFQVPVEKYLRAFPNGPIDSDNTPRIQAQLLLVPAVGEVATPTATFQIRALGIAGYGSDADGTSVISSGSAPVSGGSLPGDVGTLNIDINPSSLQDTGDYLGQSVQDTALLMILECMALTPATKVNLLAARLIIVEKGEDWDLLSGIDLTW